MSLSPLSRSASVKTAGFLADDPEPTLHATMRAAIPNTATGLLEMSANPLTPVNRELRVLQIFSVLSVGGAETWLISLLRYFREYEDELSLKIKFDLLITGGTKAVFDEEAMALGAKLFYVPFKRGNALGFMRQFRRILRDGNYDAIHDHQDYIAGLHFLMGAGHLPPIRIAHVHNPLYHRTNANGSRRRVQSAGKQLLGRLATHITGTSRQIVTEYGLDKGHFRKLNTGATHCGFDVRDFEGDRQIAHNDLCSALGWSPAAKIILFIGRLEADEVFHLGRVMTHKNPAFALEVVKDCIGKDQNVRLVMVGSGATKRREFEAQVKQWGLDEKIRFLGVRHDVPRLMLGSDLLLFPSLAEGLGMVVVEAQAAGLRVLASDAVPHECLVVPKMVCFQSLEATPSDWANEALRLMNLSQLDSMVCNSIVANSAFSIDNSALSLVQLYSGSDN